MCVRLSFLAAALTCAGALSAQAAMPPGDFNPCVAKASPALLSKIEKLTDTGAAASQARTTVLENASVSAAAVVQVACLAAYADKQITSREASRIAQIKIRERVRLHNASVDASVSGTLEGMDRTQVEMSLREALNVIIADAQITKAEQLFFGQLTDATALPQHEIRKILDLVN